MKTRTFVVSAFVVMFVLVLVVAVSAQGTQPRQPSPHRPPLPSHSRSGAWYAQSDGVGPLGPESPAVSLGQPGLSFRYVQTFGVTEEPYLVDVQHLNNPNGLFIDGSNNLYVVEERGHRMLKFNSSFSSTLSIGQVSQPWHHDNFLFYPKDVAVDNAGHIWVLIDPALKEFDSSGNLVQMMPAIDPWLGGTDNGRFSGPRGLAFDSAGRLYVSDTYNHRIQVYDLSGGAPVYSTTIGVTGVFSSSLGYFDQPAQIAFDGSDRLYVVDTGNYRVQRCTFTTTWTCVTYFGTGEAGGGLNQMQWSYGITIRGNDLYLADAANYRVLRCSVNDTPPVTCTLFAGTTGVPGSTNSTFRWPADVAVDSSGNVYVSDWDRVQKFNSSGTYVATLGVTGAPYVPDTNRYYRPWGITVASDGSLYVAEDSGYRLIKLNAAGAQQWTVGQAGVYGSDNAHFGDWWAGPQGNPAVDASGRIYVSDHGNHRVQIFNANGAYLGSLGSYGSGNYEFACPSGVAISPASGDIYVADLCNHRVQVFDSSRFYSATLGVTGVSGSDNVHFNYPRGVAVDSGGNIYVADSENHRVQKCALSGRSYNCLTFAGETGVFGDDFDHLHPIAVAVDNTGQVYIADEWNNRIQVFDSSGAYLTTIGGAWGPNTGQMRGPSGIALDSAGNVYVTDRDNHRIQKFAPDVPGWRQSNINGFGNRYNRGVTALEVFNGQLYAGASNWDEGGRVWRTIDGKTWAAVSLLGFGSAYTNTNPAIIDMAVFNGQLYAATGWDGVGGQIWRSSNGIIWTQVESNGFGDATNGAISAFAVFNNTLYAATNSFVSTHGLEIWRSSTGNSNSWSRVVTNGFNGDTNNTISSGLVVFDGYLYAAVENRTDGVEVWRTNDGITWNQVNANGFGEANNTEIGGWGVLSGYLYIGTRNDASGAQLWRSNNGTTWTQVIGNGFGDINNVKLDALMAFGDSLYAVTQNNVTGLEVWRSSDAAAWRQVNIDGFGDSNNNTTLWSNATAVFNNSLYFGTWNWNGNGGEVWQLLHEVYLPAVLRNYP